MLYEHFHANIYVAMCFHFSWVDSYAAVELLSYVVNLHLPFPETGKLFSKMTAPIYIPISNEESSSFFTS